MIVKLYLADWQKNMNVPLMLKAFIVVDYNQYSQIFSDGKEIEIPHNTHFVGYFEGQQFPEDFTYNECVYKVHVCKSLNEAKKLATDFFHKQRDKFLQFTKDKKLEPGVVFKCEHYGEEVTHENHR